MVNINLRWNRKEMETIRIRFNHIQWIVVNVVQSLCIIRLNLLNDCDISRIDMIRLSIQNSSWISFKVLFHVFYSQIILVLLLIERLQYAFEYFVIRLILQFTRLFVACYALLRWRSQGIHCWKLYQVLIVYNLDKWHIRCIYKSFLFDSLHYFAFGLVHN